MYKRQDTVIQTCAAEYDWSDIVAARGLIHDAYPENAELDQGAVERRQTTEDLVKKLNELDTTNATAVMAAPWNVKFPEFLTEGKRVARVINADKDKAISDKFDDMEKKIVDSNKANLEMVQKMLDEQRRNGAGVVEQPQHLLV